MAKALFLSFPATGHVNPSLSLVRELVQRGDGVCYFATDTFARCIERTGGHYRPYRNAFLADLTQVPDRLEALSWLLTRTTAELLEQHLDEFRGLHPDYIITDSVAPWGHWVAEILGVPLVTSVSTFAFNRHVLAFAVRHGVRPGSARLFLSKLRYMTRALRLRRELRNRYRVQGPVVASLVNGSSDLNIVYTSRYFQPQAESFSDRFVFVGPSLAQRYEAAEFSWERVQGARAVYISLGTLFNTGVEFYRSCFRAFEHQDVQVILSVGSNVALENLGPAPDNFIVQQHVPQLAVLQRAALFVTHGGMNSVNESLNYGVPMVVVPQMGEQAIVAKRVEELGAGLCLNRQDVTADTLQAAAYRVLAEPRFRHGAALVRESFETAGGVERAAEAINFFTRPRTPLTSHSAGPA